MTSSTPSTTSRNSFRGAADERHVVKCATTADFLAALPQLTGFTAQNSVFVVLFSGRRTDHAMRFDLPADSDHRGAASLLEVMSDLVHQAAQRLGDTAPAVVITSSRTFAECGGAPSRAFARQIKRRLAREGMHVRELCCVAADGWASLLDPRAPRLGRPLSEIRQSPVALEAAVHGHPTPDLSELGRLPDPDPLLAGAVAALLEPLELPGPGSPPPSTGPGTSLSSQSVTTADRETEADIREMFPGVEHPTDIEAMARIIETAQLAEDLVEQADAVQPEILAELIAHAQDHQRWAMIALSLVSRPRFVCDLALEFGPAAFYFVPVEPSADPQPAPGGMRPPTRFSVSGLVQCLASDERTRARLRAALPTLSLACVVAPEPHRPALLALRSWIWWMRGLHSVASCDLDRAAEQDPDHALTGMMRRIVNSVAAGRIREEVDASPANTL